MLIVSLYLSVMEPDFAILYVGCANREIILNHDSEVLKPNEVPDAPNEVPENPEPLEPNDPATPEPEPAEPLEPNLD